MQTHKFNPQYTEERANTEEACASFDLFSFSLLASQELVQKYKVDSTETETQKYKKYRNTKERTAGGSKRPDLDLFSLSLLATWELMMQL